jgi:hypothetical protein
VWFEKANARTHRTLRCRPIDRLAEDVAAMLTAPASWPESERRWVMRVPVDPYVRFDTNDYSLDPRFAGRRVEVRVTQTELTAGALDTGEPACRHQRSFARHRTITALEHARVLRELRGAPAEVEVEQRPAARYDAVIGA